MRLDVFLKTSRLIKRRTRAREMCDSKSVLVNGREAKPAKEIKPGDRITLKFVSRVLEIEIVAAERLSGKKHAAEDLYVVRSETRLPQTEEL